MWDNFMIALEIMWKGMLGIFAAIIIIMLVVVILGKITGPKKQKEEN